MLLVSRGTTFYICQSSVQCCFKDRQLCLPFWHPPSKKKKELHSHALHTFYVVSLQTFHTPNFGDEEFEIPSLNLPQLSGINYPHPGGHPYQQPSSLPGPGQVQQLHPAQNFPPPYTCAVSSGYTQGYRDAPVLPKFPPQSFDGIPDISQQQNGIETSTSLYQQNHLQQQQPVISAVTSTQIFHSVAPGSGLHLNACNGVNPTMAEEMLTPTSVDKSQLKFTYSTRAGLRGKKVASSPGARESEDSSDDSLPLAQVW